MDISLHEYSHTRPLVSRGRAPYRRPLTFKCSPTCLAVLLHLQPVAWTYNTQTWWKYHKYLSRPL